MIRLPPPGGASPSSRHPPERPRVGSWPSDVKAGPDATPVPGRVLWADVGTTRRRLGLRKREASAPVPVYVNCHAEPKKHSAPWVRRSPFRRHLYDQQDGEGVDCTFSAIRQWAGPGMGVLTRSENTTAMWMDQQMSITILGDSAMASIGGDDSCFCRHPWRLAGADPDFGLQAVGRSPHTKPFVVRLRRFRIRNTLFHKV